MARTGTEGLREGRAGGGQSAGPRGPQGRARTGGAARAGGRRFVARSQVPEGWLSRAKLARAAGVTRATVKHYIDLGLLPKAAFTGPNMAYYDPACVGQIALIRELQSKRHLPLATIAQILKKGGAEGVGRALQMTEALQADLLSTLSGGQPGPATGEELLAIEGINEEVLAELEELSLVRTLAGGGGSGRRYDALSRKLAQAVGLMRRQGLTEEAGFRVKDLSRYRKRLEELVDDEVRLFRDRVLGRVGAGKAQELMRGGLGGAGALVLAIRDRLLADVLEGRPGASGRRASKKRR